MANIIITLILIALIGSAVRYIWKAKKNGAKCLGCSSGCCCTHKGCGENET